MGGANPFRIPPKAKARISPATVASFSGKTTATKSPRPEQLREMPKITTKNCARVCQSMCVCVSEHVCL